MTVLAIAQAAASRLLLPAPAALVSSTDVNVAFLKTMIEQAAQEIRDEFWWPQLQKEYTFTLATGVDSYAFPGDTNSQIFETLWNRTQHWPLIGPITPSVWQDYKSGITATLPRERFRVKGIANNQFFIDPAPTASENGQTCVLEYTSRSVFRPKTWTANTNWNGNSYCSYNGNFYTRGSTGVGTTGTIAPTATDGTGHTDGSLSWTYIDPVANLATYNYATDGSWLFESIQNDTDVVVLDNKMIVDGAVWRFKRERGLEYEDLAKDAQNFIDIAKSKLAGAGTISYSARSTLPTMIGPWSYPAGNYGL